MHLTITQTALIVYSQQGFLYTLMRSLNLFFQRKTTSSRYNQIIWATLCAPGFLLLDWACFCIIILGRGWSRLVRRIAMGSPISLTRCHSTICKQCLYWCQLGHSWNILLLLRAVPGYLVPNTAVFLSLSSIMPRLQAYLCFVVRMLPQYIPDCISAFRLQYFTSLTLSITKSPSDLQPCWYWLSSFLNPSLRFPSFPPPIICKLHRFYLSLCWKSYHERETFFFF